MTCFSSLIRGYEFFIDWTPRDFITFSLFCAFGGIFLLICASPGNRLGEAQESREDETKILFIFLRITELGAGQDLKDHLTNSPLWPSFLNTHSVKASPHTALPAVLQLYLKTSPSDKFLSTGFLGHQLA